MKEGEQLQLTDGKGNLFTATISNANKKNCEVKIDSTINSKLQTTNSFHRYIITKKSFPF